MLDFSLTLVLQIKTSKIINAVAKVSIKSERIIAFGGNFSVAGLGGREKEGGRPIAVAFRVPPSLGSLPYRVVPL